MGLFTYIFLSKSTSFANYDYQNLSYNSFCVHNKYDYFKWNPSAYWWVQLYFKLNIQVAEYKPQCLLSKWGK